MSAPCPYLIPVRCSEQEYREVVRERRDGERLSDVIRRRLRWQSESALAVEDAGRPLSGAART
jgi:hypothetical protein